MPREIDATVKITLTTALEEAQLNVMRPMAKICNVNFTPGPDDPPGSLP